MKVFLDTSHLVYLKYAKDDRIADYAISLLEQAYETRVELLTSMLVLDEVVWVLTRKCDVSSSDAFELIDKLLPLLTVLPVDYNDYDTMKELVLENKLKPSDALHVASMKKADVQHLISEDKEFDRVKWIRRIWLDAKIRRVS